MAFLTPQTWTAGQIVDEDDMNRDVRDNMNQTAPALVTTKGDVVVATAANALARVAVGANGTVLKAASGEATGTRFEAPAFSEITGTDPVSDLVTTKGDIVGATAADTLARLGVGSNDARLVAASGEATGLKWSLPVQVFTKAAEELVTTNTVLQDDDDLQLTIAANEVWVIDLYLIVFAESTPDIKFGWSVPASCTIDAILFSLQHLAQVQKFNEGDVPQVTESAGTNTPVTIKGVIVNGANAGTVILQFAQVTSNAGGSGLRPGSTMIARQVA